MLPLLCTARTEIVRHNCKDLHASDGLSTVRLPERVLVLPLCRIARCSLLPFPRSDP